MIAENTVIQYYVHVDVLHVGNTCAMHVSVYCTMVSIQQYMLVCTILWPVSSILSCHCHVKYLSTKAAVFIVGLYTEKGKQDESHVRCKEENQSDQRYVVSEQGDAKVILYMSPTIHLYQQSLCKLNLIAPCVCHLWPMLCIYIVLYPLFSKYMTLYFQQTYRYRGQW